ncbi:hypothetical protein AB0H82_30560 [Streptomyces sp. NPDC050732]|uniref:hypothetical protein n=1 Tax=Streptomyces sp. NPDC050732 TaxID=3154632 RepID=UPI0034368F9F
MTALYKAELRFKGNASQWLDYGVNVGHTVNGDIHIHPPASADGPLRFRPRAANPISATRYIEVRSALAALTGACERAAAALSSARWTEAEKEER